MKRNSRSRPRTAKAPVAVFDLQIETDTQRQQLLAALQEALELPPKELLARRYPDYSTKAEQWSLWKLTSAYSWRPKGQTEEEFWAELGTDAGLRAFRTWAAETVQQLAAKCKEHPGRNAAGVRFGNNYCQRCLDGIANAQANVDVHVVPKDCFIVFNGGDSWTPIPGTGCAHWVAHEMGIVKGTVHCMASRTVRVPDLIRNTTTVARASVQVGDIWANDGRDHCGRVLRVVPTAGTPPNTITIQHDSSAQGKVAIDDFDTYFGGKGTFHR